MAVRAMVVRAVKATLVGLAIVGGAAVVAPGIASATPDTQRAVSAPAEFDPILAPVVPIGTWVCQDWPWPNGGGVDFNCAVGAGVTITAAIQCSDGRVYFRQVTGPARGGFSLFCRNGAWVTGYTVTD